VTRIIITVPDKEPLEDASPYVRTVAVQLEAGFTSGHVDAARHWTTDDRPQPEAPRPWAICEGGLIQDSSDGVECIDLDWMDQADVPTLDELERQWRLLARVVNVEHHDGWSGALHELTEYLVTAYKDYDVPEEGKVWNEGSTT